MDLLVVTELKETFGSKEKIIFAGDWVRSKINFEDHLRDRNYEFKEYKFDQTQKFKDYITELRERLIIDLVQQLNVIHNTNYTGKLWKILFDPWLSEYLEGHYYRWNLLNNILQNKKELKFIYLRDLDNFETPFDSWDFKCLITRSDTYNQYIFQKILNYIKKQNSIKINFTYSDITIDKSYHSLLVRKKSALSYFRSFINLFLYNFIKKNKFFLDINLSGYSNLILNLKLNQLPYKEQGIFSNINYLKLFKKRKTNNLNLRENLKFKNLKNIPFEKYLSENLKFEIPTVILENFSMINDYIGEIPFTPKIILSDVNCVYNLIFKFWIAKCIRNNSKFFTSEHGGSFGSIAKTLHYEEEISDLAIRWHKPIFKNNIQLPALKILRFKKMRSNYLSLKHLLMIGYETSKYPRNFIVAPIAGQNLYQANYIKLLYNNLEPILKENFSFKPYPKKIVDGGWNIDDRIKFLFPKKKFATNYKKAFKKAKIIICNYPKTTFTEAMISGPTILLYKTEYWKHTKDFNNLVSNLKEAKILFEDPVIAAQHLNRIWSDVSSWWESEKVKDVRNQFFTEACEVKENSINIWKDFLISQEKKI